MVGPRAQRRLLRRPLHATVHVAAIARLAAMGVSKVRAAVVTNERDVVVVVPARVR